jgi:hypothetical protein
MKTALGLICSEISLGERSEGILLAEIQSNGRSEAHQDWFHLEAHAPDFFDALLDLIFKGEEIGCGGFTAIYQSESMLIRDPHGTEAVTFGESGVFDEPCRGNLLLRLERRVTGHGQPAESGATFQIVVLFQGEHGIFEKRSGAEGFPLAGHDEHALQGANMANGFAGFG